MSEVIPDRMIRLPCIDPTMLVDDDTISSDCRCEYCGRRVIDGAFNDSDVLKLHEIVTKAMSYRVVQNNGPTILDINTGYLRDTDGLDNLFLKEMNMNAIYSVDDFAHYGNIIRKLKDLVMDTFSVSELFFTSPTFITRLRALDSNWEPKGRVCLSASVHRHYHDYDPCIDCLMHRHHTRYNEAITSNTHSLTQWYCRDPRRVLAPSCRPQQHWPLPLLWPAVHVQLRPGLHWR